jgi:hypothetical protein
MSEIGHNRSPFELVAETVTDLYEEARQWLDGLPVETQEQADALNTLQTRIRDAAKKAEERRKEEAKPFDDGKKEVQERYKPILSKAEQASDAVKAALKPYLLKLEAEQEAIRQKAREDAHKAQIAAMAAMQSRDASNLSEAEDAERAVKAAKEAEEAARKAENVKAHARGEGRATGLRKVTKAVMVDEREAAAWVWQDHRAELMEFTQNLADKAVRSGVRSLRGFNIIQEKTLRRQ